MKKVIIDDKYEGVIYVNGDKIVDVSMAYNSPTTLYRFYVTTSGSLYDDLVNECIGNVDADDFDAAMDLASDLATEKLWFTKDNYKDCKTGYIKLIGKDYEKFMKDYFHKIFPELAK